MGGFPGGSDSKASVCNAGDLGSIPGLGTYPGEGHGNHSGILAWKNPMDGGAWSATVHGVAKSQTRLSDFTFRSIVRVGIIAQFSLHKCSYGYSYRYR